MFIKKKKIPNTQTKIKPSKPFTHGRSRRRHRRRNELVVVVVARLVAPHRRSEIGERRSLCLCSGAQCSPLSAPSSPPSRYFALFLSESLALYLTEIKKEMNCSIADRHRRRRHRLIALPLRLYHCSGEWCSLLPPVVRPSLKVFLSNSLSDSQSLSLFIS